MLKSVVRVLSPVLAGAVQLGAVQSGAVQSGVVRSGVGEIVDNTTWALLSGNFQPRSLHMVINPRGKQTR